MTACGCNGQITNWALARCIQQAQMHSSSWGVLTHACIALRFSCCSAVLQAMSVAEHVHYPRHSKSWNMLMTIFDTPQPLECICACWMHLAATKFVIGTLHPQAAACWKWFCVEQCHTLNRIVLGSLLIQSIVSFAFVREVRGIWRAVYHYMCHCHVCVHTASTCLGIQKIWVGSSTVVYR